jgi:hypothetical protein
MDTPPDDFTVEGAINLMNKVGEEFEKRTNDKKKDDKKKLEFDDIFGTFAKIRDNKEDKYQVSNRICILIKNLFTNKLDNWKKTKDINESGPLTKAALHKQIEVEQDKIKNAHSHERYDDRRGGNRESNRRDGNKVTVNKP